MTWLAVKKILLKIIRHCGRSGSKERTSAFAKMGFSLLPLTLLSFHFWMFFALEVQRTRYWAHCTATEHIKLAAIAATFPLTVVVTSLICVCMCCRCLVGSTDQACSSGFYFRIAWKSMERPCFLQNHSFSFLQGLRSLKNWLLQKLSMKSLDQKF